MRGNNNESGKRSSGPNASARLLAATFSAASMRLYNNYEGSALVFKY